MKMREDELKNLSIVEDEKEKIDYAAGIRTLQLFGNRQYDLDDLRKEMERSSDEDSNNNADADGDKEKGEGKEANLFKAEEENEEEDIDDNSSMFKTRNKFKTLVSQCNNRRFLPLIKMNICGLVLLISLIIVGIIFEVVNLKDIDNVKKSYKLIQASSLRLFHTQTIVNRVFELILLNENILTNVADNYEEIVRTELDNSIKLLSDNYYYIVFNSFGFSPEHTRLMYNKATRVFFKDQDKNVFSVNFDINDATNQIIAKAYTVNKLPLKNITVDNSDVFFITFNLVNSCYSAAKSSMSLFISDLVVMINDSLDLLGVSIICSVLILFFSLAVLIYLFIKVSQYENQVLSIFLDIPIPKAKLLFLKCEAFLTQLQQGNEDDDLLESEDMSEYSEEGVEGNERNGKKNKKRKKIKFGYVGLRSFAIKILLVAAIVEGFFVLKFFLYKTILDNQLSIQKEVNSTLYANGMAGILLNSIRYIIVLNLKLL